MIISSKKGGYLDLMMRRWQKDNKFEFHIEAFMVEVTKGNKH